MIYYDYYCFFETVQRVPKLILFDLFNFKVTSDRIRQDEQMLGCLTYVKTCGA